MAKNKEQEVSPKEVLEVPQKIGFGNRDNYLVTETTDKRVTYIKNGKGSEDILFVIEDIRKKDPKASVERGDKKITINLSQPFEVQAVKAARQVLTLSEREQKRLEGIKEAIVYAELPEEYEDEEAEQRLKEFPKVVKYSTDDEDESYFIKSPEELWVEESFFVNNGSLLLTLSEAYLRSKKLEKGNIEYIERFENIVFNYV